MADSSTDKKNETTSKKKASKKKAKKKAKKKKVKKKKAKKKKAKKGTGQKRLSKKEREAMTALVEEIAQALYATVEQAAPQLKTVNKWGHQMYAGNGLVVGVAMHQDHVNLIVYNAEDVADPEGLMKGVGQHRSIRLENVSQVVPETFAELIRSAVAADAGRTESLYPV